MNGSVRIKTCDLELPQLLSMQSSASSQNLSNASTPTTNTAAAASATSGQMQPHGNTIDTTESGRAVDNQYTFV